MEILAGEGSEKTKPIQSQSPAFGRKSKELNPKSEGNEWATIDRAQFEKTKPIWKSLWTIGAPGVDLS